MMDTWWVGRHKVGTFDFFCATQMLVMLESSGPAAISCLISTTNCFPTSTFILCLEFSLKQTQGLLEINRYRKTTPSYYSWQRVNNHCFDKPPILPRTLKGIGTVQPLSEWSVCCRTMVEWEREAEREKTSKSSRATKRQTAGRPVKSLSYFSRLINHCSGFLCVCHFTWSTLTHGNFS